MSPKPLNAPNAPQKKKPVPRIVRSEMGHIDEGEGNIWAVSYADLLMVLMSFFIIFFSFTDPKNPEDDSLLKLAMSMSKNANVEKSVGVLQGRSDNPASKLNMKAFEELGATPVEVGKSLYLKMPDDIFDKRKFSIDSTTREKLDAVYKILEPQKNKLEVVVIGHSDSSPLTRGPANQYLSDNFDLSSLRALRALQYLLSLGFPHDAISAQGSADGVRDSRSISIRIQLRETSL